VSAANRLLSREAAPWAQHLRDGQIVTDTGEILGSVASEKQQKFAKSLVFKQWDGDFQTFDAMTAYVFGSDLYALTTEQVSAIIDYMQKSTTKWTDPRQLDLRLNDRQPATTPACTTTQHLPAHQGRRPCRAGRAQPRGVGSDDGPPSCRGCAG
jgi:hypothetical protein